MTGDVLPQAFKILKRIWGYDRLRGTQEQIVRTVAEGQDALVLTLTGGGKSLCSQVPSLIRPGVVVSPLIALMKDQVDTLRQLGVRATYLNSTLSSSASRAVKQALEAGQLDLRYIFCSRVPWSCCTARRLPFSQWTRRTASHSGGMISAQSTSNSTSCRNSSRRFLGSR